MAYVLIITYLATILVDNSGAFVNLELPESSPAFDQAIYESVLDSEKCQEQLEYIGDVDNLGLRLQFLESGLRIPRSIQSGNTEDWGSYHQCLGISENNKDIKIEGKYCILNVPAGQIIENIDVKSISDFNPYAFVLQTNILEQLKTAKAIEEEIKALTTFKTDKFPNNRMSEGLEPFQNINFRLAVCVPKSCTVQEGINGLISNLTAVGFQYGEEFCRLKDDKPWAPVDYVTIATFSLILLLTIMSTSYDLWQTHKLISDTKSINKLYQSFSVFTNTRRLLTFNSNPGSLECVDGIRAISMIWIILGHTFSTSPARENLLDTIVWTLSWKSLWVTSALMSVDTFFMLSGLLLVYTTAGKLTTMKLLKNLHLFYLNRLLRMFPLLATAILLQASILFWIADGPMWNTVARMTTDCRTYWWSTLLYVHNFVNTTYMCVPHTWYLAIDMQLHIVSPLVLLWVLSGSKGTSWISLVASVILIISATTVYNFLMEFPSNSLQPARDSESLYYTQRYYVFTVTRAPPFFVGMVFGYLLYICRGTKVRLTKPIIVILWVSALTLTTLSVYSNHPQKALEWDNQTVDSLINCFIKPAWALGLGWIIFACTHGYGGPVNWLLSLRIWKLPSRLSYGMYLFHYLIMVVSSGTAVAPIYFTVGSAMYRFLSELSISVLLSFVLTLLIDSPFSTLIKMALK